MTGFRYRLASIVVGGALAAAAWGIVTGQGDTSATRSHLVLEIPSPGVYRDVPDFPSQYVKQETAMLEHTAQF